MDKNGILRCGVVQILSIKVPFTGEVTFSRPLVQNLMLKFDPCQLLTLENYLGSHF